mmetsp:Transcript_29383/g.41348  ORF Transcript_29383/g.41348 Transcript_29383/m.41348 type:complete len:543 (+) Transcript_29383:140-1768(+)
MLCKRVDVFISIIVLTGLIATADSSEQADATVPSFDYKALYQEFASQNADRKSLISQFQDNFLKDISSHQDTQKFLVEQVLQATDCLARHQSNLVKIFLSEQEQRSASISKKDAFRRVISDLSCYDILQFILQNAPAGIEYLEAADERGWNALHRAVEFGFTEVVELLLKNGMEASKRIFPVTTVETEKGRTLPYFADMAPLHLAVVVGEEQIIELLLQYKANVNDKDFFGRTPLDIANVLYNVDHPIVKLLKQQPSLQEQEVVHETEVPLEVGATLPLKERNTDLNGGWKTKIDSALMKKFGQIPCQVRTIEAQKLKVEMFLRDHVSIKRPLRILQGASSWRSINTWKREPFQKSYSSFKVDAGSIPYGEIFGMEHKLIKVGDFLRHMDTSLEHDSEDSKPAPNYIFDHQILASSSRSLIKKDYEFHPVFKKVWNSFQQYPQFFLGGPKTGAPFHYHCHAVNGIAWGTKRWFLIPPSESFYSKEPVWEWVARQDEKEIDRYGFQCIQEASDILYVPSFWTHAVLNLKSSIGAAVETDAIYC